MTQISTLPENPLEINAGKPIDQTEYWSIIGSLMYLASRTRPEIAYAVNLLADTESIRQTSTGKCSIY